MLQESVEIPAIPVQSPVQAESRVKPHHFSNPEAARQAAYKAIEARKRNRAARLKQIEAATAILTVAAPSIVAPDEFISKKLARVRKQIEQIDNKLESSDDPKEMKMCADALARLYEVESYLSGRPKPGSRRPGRERTTRETRSASPLDLSSSNPTE